MPPSVLTVDTLYWDTVGGLLLAVIGFVWLVHLCRVGDLRVFYRWMRSWLPTYESDSPDGDGLETEQPVLALRASESSSSPTQDRAR